MEKMPHLGPKSSHSWLPADPDQFSAVLFNQRAEDIHSTLFGCKEHSEQKYICKMKAGSYTTTDVTLQPEELDCVDEINWDECNSSSDIPLKILSRAIFEVLMALSIP